MYRYQKILFLFGFILAISCGQNVESQNSKKGYAPETVKKTFQAKYPGENDPDWHVDSNGNYESRFRIDGVRHRADFSPNGSWIETEVSIEKDDLPKVVQKAIDDNYSDEEITEIERVQSAEKGLFYDVEFKRKGKNMDIEFNESGVKIN
ncbi:PepSY-like domain-containing protein [uncultured Dokdonia sp.]|uniref:PepSY-like domain-containing protein n=1 Tax=uncultured Dokdonia sp. TaxID=575653 RepID=UPI0030EF22AD|tara:strand:- start:136020 stop:136469 length:450 start_codon:yes stop_codon:yes gene_type:complete